eukprot:1461406-Rhodomonas_salina.3
MASSRPPTGRGGWPGPRKFAQRTIPEAGWGRCGYQSHHGLAPTWVWLGVGDAADRTRTHPHYY